MRPALTVLQLDTHFPRVPGDVACPASYVDTVEIIRIPAASVGRIVTEDPGQIDIEPFADALRTARGDIIATSCGFLAHWQSHLQAASARPVVASALLALPHLRTTARTTSVLTFDADKLLAGHDGALKGRADQVIGLPSDMHLRQVIERDAMTLDQHRAQVEIVALVKDQVPSYCETLLLECTNLPPYKAAIRDVFKGQIVDILSEIERRRPRTVRSEFL